MKRAQEFGRVLFWRSAPGFALLAAAVPLANGQTATLPVAPGLDLSTPAAPSGSPGTAPVGGVPAVTLDEALTRARANEPNFAGAAAAAKSASLDRSIARAALLPQVDYHNSAIYTQPNHVRSGGTSSTGLSGVVGQANAPIFIANNAVREYASQGVVTETLGFAPLTDVARASAAAAIAQAELEISRRGLTATVLTLFYAVRTTQAKVSVAERALDEASSFVKLTSEREAVREAAHADVIKAQLSQQQRQREVEDAKLGARRARLQLGVLLFADPRTVYTVVEPEAKPLPTRAEIELAANANNPQLRSALATLHARDLDTRFAREGYLPNLALNYTYGIDAEQFALINSAGVHDLGYSAAATLDIPVWDWFATHNRVRQAELARGVAKVGLSNAQRTLIAQLDEFYDEAELAGRQRASWAQSAATARESLRLTRLRYGAGEATVLEVVDAQNSLATAEIALTDGNTRYLAALANLQLLTGAF